MKTSILHCNKTSCTLHRSRKRYLSRAVIFFFPIKKANWNLIGKEPTNLLSGDNGFLTEAELDPAPPCLGVQQDYSPDGPLHSFCGWIPHRRTAESKPAMEERQEITRTSLPRNTGPHYLSAIRKTAFKELHLKL